MYGCDDCGCQFSRPAAGGGLVGECHGRPVYEEGGCCPRCGSPDYTALTACRGCADYGAAQDMPAGLCARCAEQVRERFVAALALLAREFSVYERRLLQQAAADDEDFLFCLKEAL